MAILEVQHIQKSFGSTDVLKDISFSLEKGQVLSIIGSSGSGKTTLLRCLNFLETAEKGKIIVNGQTLFCGEEQKRVSEEAIRKSRLHFGLVFQSFNLFPQYTVLENVMLAPKLLKKAPIAEIEQTARALIEQVGLTARIGSYPCQLSGGQQQRVAIGRALMNSPAVMLADEPTGSLDSQNSQEILRLLKESHRKYHQTLLLVTHDASIALQADRILTIADGRVVRDERRVVRP